MHHKEKSWHGDIFVLREVHGHLRIEADKHGVSVKIQDKF